jgi:hypothetical protein
VQRFALRDVINDLYDADLGNGLRLPSFEQGCASSVGQESRQLGATRNEPLVSFRWRFARWRFAIGPNELRADLWASIDHLDRVTAERLHDLLLRFG